MGCSRMNECIITVIIITMTMTITITITINHSVTSCLLIHPLLYNATTRAMLDRIPFLPCL